MLSIARMPDVVAAELETDPRKSRSFVEIVDMLARLEGTTLSRRDVVAASVTGAAKNCVDGAFDDGPIGQAISNGRSITLSVLQGGNRSLGVDNRIERAIRIARGSFTDEAYTVLQGVMVAQFDSIDQRKPGVSAARVEDISRRKATFQLLSAIANPRMSQIKKKCYEELAYLLQLMDDYADRFLDTDNGIQTMVTLAENDRTALNLIRKKCKEVKAALEGLYESHKLTELFAYIDRFALSAGIKL